MKKKILIHDKCAGLRVHLVEQMQDYVKEDCMVAFSGGADSSILLAVAVEMARKTGKKVYAVTVHTKLHPSGDLEEAKKAAEEMGAIHLVLYADELLEAGVIENPTDRCYRCKKLLFSMIKERARDYGVTNILEGTNEDDLHVYRPGIAALRELGIKSPLADAKLTKQEVRELAKEYKISAGDKPSAPCLATRFPYGTKLSYEDMGRLEKGEEYIRSLGGYNVRIRVHREVLRLEVDEDFFPTVLKKRREILSYLKELGYSYITLDLEGFRSGSMDEILTEEEK